MKEKNLLAIIKPGDEKHYLFKRFTESLPEKTKMLLDSGGYLGRIDDFIDRNNNEDWRHFLIYRAPSFEDLNKDYFVTEKTAAFFEIPDNLIVEKVYSTFFEFEWRTCYDVDSGNIDDMVKFYNKLNREDPITVLMESISKSERIKKSVTKRKFLNFRKRKVGRTYVTIGLSTPNRDYLLSVKATGPYKGGSIKA